MSETQPEQPQGYQESADHVPDPTAVSGTLETSHTGNGEHSTLAGVAKIFGEVDHFVAEVAGATWGKVQHVFHGDEANAPQWQEAPVVAEEPPAEPVEPVQEPVTPPVEPQQQETPPVAPVAPQEPAATPATAVATQPLNEVAASVASWGADKAPAEQPPADPAQTEQQAALEGQGAAKVAPRKAPAKKSTPQKKQ